MTPERFRECMSIIGWSMRSLSERLGVHETLVRQWWATGRKPIPEVVATWLEALTAAHEAHPLPAGWKIAA
jgi:transcriptional regulator with XRE-family HTH domain